MKAFHINVCLQKVSLAPVLRVEVKSFLVKFDSVQASAHWIPSKATPVFLFISLGLWKALGLVAGARILGGGVFGTDKMSH